MKILPKRAELNKAKADEQKREIDAGMFLSKKVDEMRTLHAEQERLYRTWVDVTRKELQAGIDTLVQEKETLAREVQEAREHRTALQAPLTDEWNKLTAEKLAYEEAKTALYLAQVTFESDKIALKEEEAQTALLYNKAIEYETQTKHHEETARLAAEHIEQEYETVRRNTEAHTEQLAKALKEVTDEKIRYETALQTLTIKEEDLVEKEKALIIREQDVQRRIERMKYYGNSKSTDN